MKGFKQVKNQKDWDDLKEGSKIESVAILKYSNTCPISFNSKKSLIDAREKGILKKPIYILTVQESRELSDIISKELQVIHETPQIIVVKDKKAVYNSSHDDINPDDLARKLK